jgi:hypothetical protein
VAPGYRHPWIVGSLGGSPRVVGNLAVPRNGAAGSFRKYRPLSPLVRVPITVANRSCGSQSGPTDFAAWLAFS